MKLRKTVSVIADISVIFMFVYLLIFPQYASEPTREALYFCGTTLIPSLFIYMVLAKIVITLPITDKLTQKIGCEAVTLITGTLCGCPVGAKTAKTLYETGRITKKHAEYLCSFTNNASVSFVIGFAGNELFGDTGTGLRLLAYQMIASVAAAVIMKALMFGKTPLPKPEIQQGRKTGLREAVADSAVTMLNLCACVVFFIVAGGVISNILSLDTLPDAVLKSVLEFSSGCAAASKTGRFALSITAFAIGQTGFSVALQVRSVIANKLSIRPFILGKLICGTVMTALAVFCG